MAIRKDIKNSLLTKLARFTRVSRKGMVAKSFKRKGVTPGARKVRGGTLRFENSQPNLTRYCDVKGHRDMSYFSLHEI